MQTLIMAWEYRKLTEIIGKKYYIGTIKHHPKQKTEHE